MNNVWDFHRSPASVALMLAYGREQGLAPATLLAGSRLTEAQLVDPNTLLSAAQELAVVSQLLRALGHPPGLGLAVGARYHFSHYGLWGYGLITCATAGDALALALRFLPLSHAFTTIAYREEGPLGVLSFGAPDVAPGLQRFLVERDLAGAAVLLQEVAGADVPLAWLRLQAPRPATRGRPAPALDRPVAGAVPQWGAPDTSLAFDRRLLTRPLPQANALTLAQCEQLCAQLLEQRRARLGTAQQVRQQLAHRGAAPAHRTLGALARQLHLSERTLKRRLQAEGTSLRALQAQARQAQALALLADARLSLGEVADRLGFADLSSFSQAFKRWQGVSPRAYRLQRDG
ncbi:AraC family transcriptional regulator [Ideonella sp. B7]|uniref:AraC family transcriptional regulator n=1 Tax=Ideonella benzenivorans TaxID=2831643 RepID=UPI001CECA3D4|nr:AraC family transcriptional regulator [Ideonella benzenivorans]MCA6218397.1 AraC family transcriptional regulator [Ideonella benzenivorans]